jgi:putative transcriptional regulator
VLRAERKWTQADLGEKIGVSRNSINAIENGKHDPSLPLAFCLAKHFGLPVEQVFEDES